VVINVVILMAIGGYSVVSHWWLFHWLLLMPILLMIISGYCIICYITTIGDCCIINYCWIFLFIIS